MASRKKFQHACPIRYTLDLIGGKWKLPIVSLLARGSARFTELERTITGISARMLIKELKELEAHGLLTRTVYAAVPSHVEYTLTATGQSLGPMLQVMHVWGLEHMPDSPGSVPPGQCFGDELFTAKAIEAVQARS